MRPLGIVVLPPCLHDPTRIAESQEPVLVQAFVTQPTVEALTVGVLDRVAGVDEVQGDGMLVRPFLQRPTDQLRAVVEYELHRAFPLSEEASEDLDNSSAWQGGINLEGQGFPAKDVDDAEHAQFAPRGQRILEEIERPLLIDVLGRGGATTPDGGQRFPGPAAHRQAFLPVEAFHPLVVDDDPLPPQQDVQAPIAEAGTLCGQVPQSGTQRFIIT